MADGLTIHKNGDFIDKVSKFQILQAVQLGTRLKTIILLADGICQTIVTQFFDPLCLATPESEIKVGRKIKEV
jgi:hypothetical protein